MGGSTIESPLGGAALGATGSAALTGGATGAAADSTLEDALTVSTGEGATAGATTGAGTPLLPPLLRVRFFGAPLEEPPPGRDATRKTTLESKSDDDRALTTTRALVQKATHVLNTQFSQTRPLRASLSGSTHVFWRASERLFWKA